MISLIVGGQGTEGDVTDGSEIPGLNGWMEVQKSGRLASQICSLANCTAAVWRGKYRTMLA